MTQPMSDEQLAEIRERELSASEGPWLFKGTERQDDLSLRLTIGEAPAGEEIARIEVSAEAAGWSFHRARAQADAEFIAHARSDIPALLAEVMRLRKALHNGRAERDRLRTERDDLAAQNAKTESNFEEFAEVIIPERDRLAEQVKRVRELHSAQPLYEECGHRHDKADATLGVKEVYAVGLVCQDGYDYTVCRACCCDPDGDQSRECAENHDRDCWPCPTARALDGTEAGR